ncbi:MAG: hypothetical protein M5U01_03285 [Ardenticatenaceae bacterium]|nr:hypothetical protein [Ardenticatenaceae bacterium]HBY93396.1 hypothetical protein [Chloroflexota bacterium]
MTPDSNFYPHAADNFVDGYTNSDYRLPLQNEQLDYFYVSRREQNSRLELLKKELLWGAEKRLTTKFLLSGHVGCGKSTELNRSVKEIERDLSLRESLFVVPYSVNEVLDLQDVDYTDIAFSIVVGIYNRLQKLDIAFPRSSVDEVIGWIAAEVERFTTSTIGVEMEVGADGGLPRMLSLLNLLGIKVRGGGMIAKEARAKVKKRAPELRHLVNHVLEQVKELSGMNILLVIDDLDKLPRSEALRVFRDDGPFLTLLNCMAVYTAPVSLMYELGNSPSFEPYRAFPVPMFKIRNHNDDEGYNEYDIEKMTEMIYRRISPQLFDDGVVDQLVRSTGGVVRHLIKMARDCCLYCATFSRDVIDQEILDWVINEFKKDFSRRLDRADYSRLKRIHLEKGCESTEQAWEYLHSLCVLEYVNGDYWYDVHPVVLRLIEEREPIEVE